MSKRARVLVIDDDPLFRSLLVSLLRKDYFVSVAGEGAEGFYKALEHPPDVAIIDIKMPGWDGLKTLKAFRGHPSLTAVKAVILTADASKETVLAAINGGAKDYIIKTAFSRDDFYAKLDKLIPRPAQAAAPAPQPVAVDRGNAGLRAARLLGQPASQTCSTSVERPSLHPDDERTAVQELIDDWE